MDWFLNLSRKLLIDLPNRLAAFRPIVTVGFRNGLTYASAREEILGPLQHEFDLRESTSPAICFVGPYGAEPAPPGAVRVGYWCENIWPEPNRFDWCFGTWEEDIVRHPRYTRITWHGFDPESLVKTQASVDHWRGQARKFCAFIYSHRVAHRESFCRALTAYKPIDCPGQSLRNMPPIDDDQGPEKWDRKRQFLASYRFTIAFENSSAPGYHTEKILDPMVAGSIPIYWGDSRIAQYFNPRSFVNVAEYISPLLRSLDGLLRRIGRRTIRDYQPMVYSGAMDKYRRRGHHLADIVADALLRSRGWQPLIAAIRQIDTDQDRYFAMLEQPWLSDNRVPPADRMRERLRHLLLEAANR